MSKKYVVSQGCTLCGMCAADCTAGAITITPSGAKIDPEKCMGCGICYKNCASEAITEVPIRKDEKDVY